MKEEERQAHTGPSSVIPRLVVPSLISRALADQRKILSAAMFYMVMIGVVIGLLWAPLHEVFRDLPQAMNELIRAITGGSDLSTPVGWANAEMLSLVAPAALAVAAISPAAALSAEEQTGRLSLTLSAPVGRTVLFVSRCWTMVISVALVSLSIGGGLALASVIGGLGYSADGILGVTVHSCAFGLTIGSAAFLLSAVTGSRRGVILGSVSIIGIAFVVSTFFPLSASLKGWQRFSIWHMYNGADPLANGTQWAQVGVLVVCALLCAALAFHRRDLRA